MTKKPGTEGKFPPRVTLRKDELGYGEIEYLSLAEHEAELTREREKNKQLEAALDVQVGMIACSGCEERDEKAKELVFALKRIAGRGLANTTYMHVAEEPLAKYREEKK